MKIAVCLDLVLENGYVKKYFIVLQEETQHQIKEKQFVW